ncbi:aminotransferase class IV [Swingsia samuiensis]|uniref:Probable branched-chain-amino-acid aminotransferase n=1 Tax=Swingsia samuiensis TaxID=1293412 RepID=A0A4Y6UKS3_9PROT|nr:aminotransferase class IV [Swingsia samuiensis]QDH17001.1 aminotransferase class IV [Swingsia samuiensis]
MTDYVWLNGNIQPLNDTSIHPRDRGFLLGDGLFETMRIKNRHIPKFSDHIERLLHGCRILMLPPPRIHILEKAISDLISLNHIHNGSLRLTLSRGCGPRGITPPTASSPTVFIQVFPQSAQSKLIERLCINSQYKRDALSPLTAVKSLNYLPFILAKMKAQQDGFDDAILLNHNNSIADSTSANILYLMNNNLYTPPLKDGALPGISRKSLIQNNACVERSICPAEISNITSIWLISALSIREISHVGKYCLEVNKDKTIDISTLLFNE